MKEIKITGKFILEMEGIQMGNIRQPMTSAIIQVDDSHPYRLSSFSSSSRKCLNCGEEASLLDKNPEYCGKCWLKEELSEVKEE